MPLKHFPDSARFVFLDFDGVLHPGLAGTFIYLPLFEEFLRRQHDVLVVISSTWRLDQPIQDILRLFSDDVRPRVVGVTPSIQAVRHGARYAEIHSWLVAHQASHLPWVALDDDESLYPFPCHQLVKCDAARGLRAQHLVEVCAKLKLKR